MSVYYEVNEHLVINDTTKHFEIADIAISQLCLMGTWLLQNRGRFASLTAIADGVKFSFSGSIVTQDYHKLIDALHNAVNIELVSSYGYSYHSDTLDPGPFVMVDFLQELAANAPEELHGIFYSMYNNADCDSTAGALVALV